MGCDLAFRLLCSIRHYFNPRTPRGVRHPKALPNDCQLRFQSTHPAWGATNGLEGAILSFFISIHAPRVGCDPANNRPNPFKAIFQSTHPAWGATGCLSKVNSSNLISIHAPRVGCDKCYNSRRVHFHYFNPRTPRGVRRRGRGNNRF